MQQSRRHILVGSLATVATATLASLLSTEHRYTGEPSLPSSLGPLSSNTLTTVVVEENGWVIRVRGAWAASTFADFDLDPDHVSRIQLVVRSAGFEPRNGAAVPTQKDRTVHATKPLRKSEAGPPMDLQSLDEREMGDGLREVRIALSNPVFREDQVLGATILPNWRRGHEGMQQAIVTNGSHAVVELPTMRWAVPSFKRVTRNSDVRLDLVVASAHAEGRQAVAGIRFSATDGYATNELWQTTLSDSVGWGDGLRCWGAMASELCSGLNPGPVTIHAEVYPFIGQPRSTGRNHETSKTAALKGEAERPIIMVWDPDGEFLPEAHVYVDSSTGTPNPSLVTVAESLEGAKGGTAAASLSVAAQAIWLANRTIPASNGWPAVLRAGDGATITIAQGTHKIGTFPTGPQAAIGCGHLVIRGDPSVDLPAQNCRLEVGDRPRWGYQSLELRNLALGIGGAFMAPEAIVHFQGVTTYQRPGQEGSTRTLFAPTSDFRLTMISSEWSNNRVALRGPGMQFGLLRSVEVSRSCRSPLYIQVSKAPHADRDFIVETHASSYSLPQKWAYDIMLWGCRFYRCSKRTLMLPTSAHPDRADHLLMLRFRMVNCLFEMVDPDGKPYDNAKRPPINEKFFDFGENDWINATDCLFEGNTFVGQRVSLGYNDPPTGHIDQQLLHNGVVCRNNYFDRNSTKHDQFHSPYYGRRPGFTGGWSILYGVGYESNVSANRLYDDAQFPHEYYGRFSKVHSGGGPWQGNGWVGFTHDQSMTGLSGSRDGHGDYTPMAGSPLLGMCMKSCTDVDIWGRFRPPVFDAGAFQSLQES